MAETLTYDATPAEPEILNADEQDSLKIGEELQEQQESLLAGKYKNAEDLEKAYVELEKKLGGNKPEETTEESSEPEAKEEKEEEKPDNTALLDDLWEQAQAEKFDDKTLDQISNKSSRDVANMHLQYRANQTTQELTESDVKELKGVVGGEKEYSDMMQWATKTLNKTEIDMFDKVMEQGNPLAAFFAVRSLAYRYNDAVGVDGQMTTGTAPRTSGDVFRSQAELVKAMADQRYDRDPAYRQDVIAKLARSDIEF